MVVLDRTSEGPFLPAADCGSSSYVPPMAPSVVDFLVDEELGIMVDPAVASYGTLARVKLDREVPTWERFSVSNHGVVDYRMERWRSRRW